MQMQAKKKSKKTSDLIYQQYSNVSFGVCLCASFSLLLCACMIVCVSVHAHCHSHFFHAHTLNKLFFRSFEDHLLGSCTIFKANAYLTPTVQQF